MTNESLLPRKGEFYPALGAVLKRAGAPLDQPEAPAPQLPRALSPAFRDPDDSKHFDEVLDRRLMAAAPVEESQPTEPSPPEAAAEAIEDAARNAADDRHIAIIGDRDFLRATAMEAVSEARRVSGRASSPWTSEDGKAAYLIADLLLIIGGLSGHVTSALSMPGGSPEPSRAVKTKSAIADSVERGLAEAASKGGRP